MSATNRMIVGAAGATVLGLAGVAGAISYSHMAELARLHGEVGWRAHAFPVSVDGIEIVASLVLLAHRRAGTRAGWLPWAALVAGTAASVAANVAVGGSDPVGRLVAGWPAVALLVSIKLMSGLLETTPAGTAMTDTPRDGTAGPGSPGPADPVLGAGTSSGPNRQKRVNRDGDRRDGTGGTERSVDQSRAGTDLATGGSGDGPAPTCSPPATTPSICWSATPAISRCRCRSRAHRSSNGAPTVTGRCSTGISAVRCRR